MSKYNLTDILNEYIGGGRIGTLKTSYRDLVDIMDKLEKSDKVIVRELPGPSGDGKTNREFEVVDRDSAVAGGRKQERGFTVYDYKFGFDPGSINNYEEEYDFSVGGNDLKLAMELIPDVKPYRLEELDVDSIQNDPGSGDADNPTGEELEASGGYDAAMEESHCYDEDDINEGEFDEARQAAIESSQEKAGIKINEGDLFSSEFDRAELKDIINDLNKGLILDMPTRRAYKFLVSLLDKEDRKEMGLNEQMYIDDEEFNKEMGRSKKDALRQEMMFHVNQLMDGNIDKNDFMNVVDDIMMDLGLKESTGPSDKAETEDDVVNIDKVAGPSAKGVGYGAETSANTAEDDMEDKEVANPRPMYENGDTSDFTSELKEESSKKVKIRAYLKDYYTNPKDPKDVRIDDELIDEFFEYSEDIPNFENMDMDEIVDEYDEFIFQNKDVMEDVRKQFKRFL